MNNSVMKSDELSQRLKFNRENGYPELTSQQKVFANRYFEDFDIIAATEAVAIAKSTGLKWLRNPLVSDYVEFLTKDFAEGSVIRREWVELQWLETWAKLSGKAESEFVNRDGDSFMVKKFHASESVSALKELTRLSGLDKDSKGTGGTTIHINLEAFGLQRQESVTIEGEIEDAD